MTHEYYHLPFLPIASIFAGIGLTKFVENVKLPFYQKNIFVASLFLIVFIFALLPIKTRAYGVIERFEDVPALGDTIQRITSKNDLVIGVMDSGPAVVHYSGRKGWGMEIDQQKAITHREFFAIESNFKNPIDRLEELRAKGAVLIAFGYKKQLDDNLDFKNYLYSTYKVIEETENTLIFDLKGTKADS